MLKSQVSRLPLQQMLGIVVLWAIQRVDCKQLGTTRDVFPAQSQSYPMRPKRRILCPGPLQLSTETQRDKR